MPSVTAAAVSVKANGISPSHTVWVPSIEPGVRLFTWMSMAGVTSIHALPLRVAVTCLLKCVSTSSGPLV